jgi:peroxiredoxin
MNKQTLYWVRRILLVAMIGLIGFAFYRMMGQGAAPEVGDSAPSFALTTLAGEKSRLADLQGKAVVLNFWATWCEPCRREMPAMQTMYEKYKEQGLEIVAVNMAETEIAVSAFAQQYGFTFPIWMDKEQEAVQLYGIGPIPTTFFIDATGMIRQKATGSLELSQLEQYIRSILPRK